MRFSLTIIRKMRTLYLQVLIEFVVIIKTMTCLDHVMGFNLNPEIKTNKSTCLYPSVVYMRPIETV